jgi:glycosyltransferase involved in cell wall biosynthesis
MISPPVTSFPPRDAGRGKTVLIISDNPVWSMGRGRGSSSFAHTIQGYLDGGWRVCFISGHKASTAETGFPGEFQVRSFDARSLKGLSAWRKVDFIVRSLWWLYFQCAAGVAALMWRLNRKFDLICGYETCAAPVSKILSKAWNIPLVLHCQGTLLGDFRRAKCWKARAWIHVLAMKIRADLIVMTDDGSQGDKVLRILGADMDRVRFWLNGIDVRMFQEPRNRSEAKTQLNLASRFIRLTSSRLVSWKRVDRAIRALPGVIEALPDTRLIVLGDGPARPALEHLARDLGVGAHVRFEGAVRREMLPLYYVAADVFLSLYDLSNVGNPLFEAMLAGKCTVTLDTGDTGKFIRNGNNGILLSSLDLPGLSRTIINLLQNEELRDTLGNSAQKYAEANFWTWEDRMAAEMAEIDRLFRFAKR